MITRREYLGNSALAGAALVLPPGILQALEGDIITRAIPSTGEKIPVVGLGSSATFRSVAQSDDVTALRDVLSTLFENGGSVFDTAPGYGASEEVAGGLVQELNATKKVFWATKVNVAGRGGGSVEAADVRQQIERSFNRMRVPVIDLNQVHNMGDPPTQLGVLQEYKESGRIRYIGMTTTSSGQYGALASVMREYPIDFIGIDYAVDNRGPEEVILPLAQERRIGVIVYLPFGRNRLWGRIGDRPLPDWAAEFDAHSWAQFMLKFVIANPAVTVATPGTSDPEHMADNLAAGRGGLPNAQQRERMIELVESLPRA